jgi:hypothetical protein
MTAQGKIVRRVGAAEAAKIAAKWNTRGALVRPHSASTSDLSLKPITTVTNLPAKSLISLVGAP